MAGAMGGGGGGSAAGGGIDERIQNVFEGSINALLTLGWSKLPTAPLAGKHEGLAGLKSDGIWAKDTQGIFKPTTGFIKMPQQVSSEQIFGQLPSPPHFSGGSSGHGGGYDGIG